MKIYLELLLFIYIPMIIFILWYLWNQWSKKRLIKKYDPEKDMGKKAEDKRKERLINNDNTKKGGINNEGAAGRESKNATATKCSSGSEQPKGNMLLPAAKTIANGKTSNSNRKNGFGIRRFLRRK